MSPSSRSFDLGAKHYAYAQAGVRNYWVVDPEPPIELVVFELVGSGYHEAARLRDHEQYDAPAPLVVTIVPERLHEV